MTTHDPSKYPTPEEISSQTPPQDSEQPVLTRADTVLAAYLLLLTRYPDRVSAWVDSLSDADINIIFNHIRAFEMQSNRNTSTKGN